MRTIKLQIAATETRCGGMSEDCQFSEKHNSGCGAFAGLRTRRDGRCGYWYERLPECIAACFGGGEVKLTGQIRSRLMSSPAEAKQMEPEGKPTSQVRLWWEPMEGQRWVVTLPTLTLSVEPIDGGLQWSALVEVPNGADLCEYFATHEEAKKYCVEKARELLRQDLKSLGGGVQAEPAEVKP